MAISAPIVVSAPCPGYTRVVAGNEAAIRDSAEDISQLQRTILLFTDVSALQTALGIERTDAIHVVVLGAQGKVRLSVTGPYSDEAAQTVSAALALSPVVARPACHQTTFDGTGR